MGGQEDLTGSLKAIMARRREGLGGPPTPEELLAYRDDRLSPEERQRLEARLAVHPDAARALADLAAFPAVEPAPGTPELSDDEIDARWQAFRDQLPELPGPVQQEGGRAPVLPSTGARPRTHRWPAAPQLAAAALAGVAVGSAAVFLGGRPPHDIPESAINVQIVELRPVGEGDDRSSAETLEPLEGSEEVVLVLGAPAVQDFADYEAEVEDAAGSRLWERGGLRPTPMGTFHLSFRRGAFQPGPLRIHLFGRDGESRTPLATYEVQWLAGRDPR